MIDDENLLRAFNNFQQSYRGKKLKEQEEYWKEFEIWWLKTNGLLEAYNASLGIAAPGLGAGGGGRTQTQSTPALSVAEDYIAAVLSAGGTFPAGDQTATLTLGDSLEGGSINYIENLYELYLFKGETWNAGRIGFKQDYNLSDLTGRSTVDEAWGATGFGATGYSRLDTGINISTFGVTEFGMGFNLSYGTPGGADRIMGTNISAPGHNISLSAGIFLAGAIFNNGAFANIGRVPLPGETIHLHGRTGPPRGAELYLDAASLNTSTSGNTSDPDTTLVIGDYGSGGIGFGSDNSGPAYSGYVYISKIGFSDAQVSEFDGIMQTWLTAVGR